MNLIKKNILTIAGIMVGALSGYLYYHFIGCNSGTCSITSNPTNNILYGAVMGGLIFSLFKKQTTKTQ
jgi:hypothetical protein